MRICTPVADFLCPRRYIYMDPVWSFAAFQPEVEEATSGFFSGWEIETGFRKINVPRRFVYGEIPTASRLFL